MYDKGDVKISRINDNGREVFYLPREKGTLWKLGTTIYLPHCCDEWEIGGIEEAQLMIEDLQEAIKILKENSNG